MRSGLKELTALMKRVPPSPSSLVLNRSWIDEEAGTLKTGPEREDTGIGFVRKDRDHAGTTEAICRASRSASAFELIHLIRESTRMECEGNTVLTFCPQP